MCMKNEIYMVQNKLTTASGRFSLAFYSLECGPEEKRNWSAEIRGNPFTLSGISHTILGLSHPWDAKFRGISWINEFYFLASTGCLSKGAESLQGQLWPPNRAKEYQVKKYENTTRDRMTVVLLVHITWGWFINSWGLWQKNHNVWFSCFGMETSLPCRYISSPSVNIWLHLLHRAQLGW